MEKFIEIDGEDFNFGLVESIKIVQNEDLTFSIRLTMNSQKTVLYGKYKSEKTANLIKAKLTQ